MVLRRRILLLVAGGLIAPLLVLIVAGSAATQHTLSRQQQRETESAVKTAELLYSGYLDNARAAANSLAVDAALQAMLADNPPPGSGVLEYVVRERLQFFRAFKVIDFLEVTDRNGRIVVSTVSGRTGAQVAVPAAASDVSAGIESVAERSVLVARAPVFSHAGVQMGSVAAGFAVADTLLPAIQRVTGAHAALFAGGALRQSTFLADGYRGVMNPTPGVAGAATINGEEHNAAYVGLSDSGGNAVALVGVFSSRALEQSLRVRSTIITLGIVVILLMFVFIVYAGLRRSVIAPLSVLTQAAGRIARGDYDEPLKVAAEGEIDELAKTFEHMRVTVAGRTRELEESRAELDTYASRLEERVAERTRELERANRAKSQFLANVSHELRTPINGISGFAELLLERPLDVEAEDYARTILDSSSALLRIINDLLDLSKIEAGRMEIESIAFSPRKVVEDVTRTLVPLARTKGLNLSATGLDALPAAAMGDPARLRQVLLNLVGNAVKFTHAGHVSVDASVMPTTATDGRGELQRVRFAVRDTGIGIPPEKRTAIFEPFVQADTSTTREYGGTGLGLSIARRIVEEMGGTIAVENNMVDGHGTVFVVTLPLSPADPADLPVASHTGTSHSGISQSGAVTGGEGGAGASERDRRVTGEGVATLPGVPKVPMVVVAEDNPNNAKLYGRVLEKLGYVVVTASTGADAVEAMRRHGAAVVAVLMDMQMPVLDGYAATAELRRLGFTRVPILALTASAMPGDRERCLAAGASDYMAKPAPQSAIAEWITAHAPIARGAPREVRPDAARDVPGEPTLAEARQADATLREPMLREPTRRDSLGVDLRQVVPESARSFAEEVLPVMPRRVSSGVDPFSVLDAELMAEYRATVHELVAEVVAAAMARDGAKVAALGHQFKGSGGSYGFDRISELGALIEAAGASKRFDAVAGYAAEIRACVDVGASGADAATARA